MVFEIITAPPPWDPSYGAVHDFSKPCPFRPGWPENSYFVQTEMLTMFL